MGDRYRNNLGQWKTTAIAATSSQKSSELYALKDVEMAREADYGLMVGGRRSSGTRSNVHNLLHTCVLIFEQIRRTNLEPGVCEVSAKEQ
jgi:hypothetical protein